MLMGKRVWDAEISEGCLVMRWIGIKYGSMSVDLQQDRTENSTILSCPQRDADFREAKLTALCFGRSLIMRTFVRLLEEFS